MCFYWHNDSQLYDSVSNMFQPIAGTCILYGYQLCANMLGICVLGRDNPAAISGPYNNAVLLCFNFILAGLSGFVVSFGFLCILTGNLKVSYHFIFLSVFKILVQYVCY